METFDRKEMTFPVLTQIARSYRNEEFIAEKVFPEVKVDAEILEISISEKSSFLLFNTNRSSGTGANIIPPDTANTLTVRLQKKDLATLVDRSELQFGNPVKSRTRFQLELKIQKVREAKQSVLLSTEMQAARLVQDPGNFNVDNTLAIVTGANRFDSDSSDPLGIIQDCKRMVRTKIAKDPNTITMSYEVYLALKNHLQFKSISPGKNGLVTHEWMKEILEIENILVGNAVFIDKTGGFQNVWNNNVVLSYQPKSSPLNSPVFGHTFRHIDYPYSKEYWNDNEREVLAVKYADLSSINIIHRDAGFLIMDAI